MGKKFFFKNQPTNQEIPPPEKKTCLNNLIMCLKIFNEKEMGLLG